MIDAGLVSLALAAATVVKIVVDLVKLALSGESPQWVPPLLALVLGPIVVVLLLLAAGQPLTTQTLAQAVLAGILSAGVAVGVTDIGKRAQLRTMQRRGYPSR